MKRCIRATFYDGSKMKSVLLEFVGETEFALRGYEINDEAERISPRGADQRLRIISFETIASVTDMEMNTHYGTLQPCKA